MKETSRELRLDFNMTGSQRSLEVHLASRCVAIFFLLRQLVQEHL